MTIKTEGVHNAEILLSEANGALSRAQIVLAAGAALAAGTVLGLNTTSQEYDAYDDAGTDGLNVAVGVLYNNVAASEDARQAVAIVRLAEVHGALLTGLDSAAEADLLTRNIVVR